MDEPVCERRTRPRHRMPLAVVVTGTADWPEVHAITRDISAGGIFFYTDVWPDAARDIEFRVILPPEITLTTMTRAVCHGKVIRVEKNGVHGKTGVAATIACSSFA